MAQGLLRHTLLRRGGLYDLAFPIELFLAPLASYM